ncbi:hypothetical protein Hdeb2414_s1230g00994381 [Helianthus debilis subsp. tardiflorus]
MSLNLPRPLRLVQFPMLQCPMWLHVPGNLGVSTLLGCHRDIEIDTKLDNTVEKDWKFFLGLLKKKT